MKLTRPKWEGWEDWAIIGGMFGIPAICFLIACWKEIAVAVLYMVSIVVIGSLLFLGIINLGGLYLAVTYPLRWYRNRRSKKKSDEVWAEWRRQRGENQ